jgi:hypothetical protein
MGLDITAYSKLTPAPNAEYDPVEDGLPMDSADFWLAHRETIMWTEEQWPGRTTGVEPGMVYATGERLTFSAGSYGGYGQWRTWLATVAGFQSPQDVWEANNPTGPFVELIDFADNEGVIGPVVAAKLAKDFADYEGAACKAVEDNDNNWNIERYRMWRRAFELAANQGAVEFR